MVYVLLVKHRGSNASLWGMFRSQSKPGKVEPSTFVANTKCECFFGGSLGAARACAHACMDISCVNVR